MRPKIWRAKSESSLVPYREGRSSWRPGRKPSPQESASSGAAPIPVGSLAKSSSSSSSMSMARSSAARLAASFSSFFLIFKSFSFCRTRRFFALRRYRCSSSSVESESVPRLPPLRLRPPSARNWASRLARSCLAARIRAIAWMQVAACGLFPSWERRATSKSIRRSPSALEDSSIKPRTPTDRAADSGSTAKVNFLPSFVVFLALCSAPLSTASSATTGAASSLCLA
mmetsp:Transcript_68847/g.155726  ORF Transcript_68847/g.155726 Transcript_68847/m.155726 type:complete len:228 (-) Transcript_68847:1034-1717(-)